MNGTSFSARTGQIARLARDIRQQLNHRLEDGESAQELVAWLNETPAVKERLARYYERQPITAQKPRGRLKSGGRDAPPSWRRTGQTEAGPRASTGRPGHLGEVSLPEMSLQPLPFKRPLSDWKQGGFPDWQRHQESRGVLREFLSEAEEVGEEAGEELLLDRVVRRRTPRVIAANRA